MTYETFDPFDGMPDGTDADQWLSQQGWTDSIGIGSEDSPMRIRSYQRTVNGEAEYIVDVWDILGGTPYIKVPGPGELMDLLARWAPAAQAASVVQLVDELVDPSLDTTNVVGRVAAKVIHGVEEVLPAMRRHEREVAAHRRQARLAREAQAAKEAQ